MFLNAPFPFIKSFRYHFLIGVSLGFFIGFLVIFLEPMGANNYSDPYKNLYFAGYGGIVFLSYLLFVSLSNVYMHFLKVWKWLEEILFSFLFISIVIVITFLYTELCINKSTERLQLDWFLWWYQNMFLGFGILVSILMIVLRRYYGLKPLSKEEITSSKISNVKEVTVKGALKKDVFECVLTDILFVRSEDNYVFISHLTPDGIKEKMLRSTLKNIHAQLPDLIRIHRSFIIHPIHVKELRGNAQNAKIYLKGVENPITVSKTYFESIKKELSS
ncbi:LytTR family DNA-binding domain-containing protein [Dokdonia sp.]|uniref:LytTR family DNA-binding domain-containing protein n=1 Tax=Dokdonia sp. TaxID=2024995 RepID=UPI003267AC0A